jgi:hypothetical protein
MGRRHGAHGTAMSAQLRLRRQRKRKEQGNDGKRA